MESNMFDKVINFITAATPGGIEAQERQGQRELVHSDTLPIEGDWDTLTRWGVVKGEPVDDLFYQCKLPEGWSKVDTDHSMWSDLQDERGLKRASIFYKAAFYDRDAKFHIVKRFSMGSVYQEREDRLHCKHYQVYDNALNKAVFIDTPAYSAEHDKHLVAVKDGVVYKLNSNGILVPNHNLLASNVKLLSYDEFYDKWHGRKSGSTNYPHIKALESLAEIECKSYLSQLPTDDSVWNASYDFPAV